MKNGGHNQKMQMRRGWNESEVFHTQNTLQRLVRTKRGTSASHFSGRFCPALLAFAFRSSEMSFDISGVLTSINRAVLIKRITKLRGAAPPSVCIKNDRHNACAARAKGSRVGGILFIAGIVLMTL